MNLNEHLQDFDSVVSAAAEIYGQFFDEQPEAVQARWRDAVTQAIADEASGGTGQTALEQAAHQAIREWRVAKLSAQVIEVLPTPEPTGESIPIVEAAPVATEAKPEKPESKVVEAPAAPAKAKKR